MGDNQVLLQSIKGSAYYDAFGDRASAWERRLTDLDEVKLIITKLIFIYIFCIKVLHNMNTAQRKWVSLEPYQEQMKLKQNTGGFNYREVATLDQNLYWLKVLILQVFQRIDDDFRLIMGDAVKDPRVIAILRCFNLLPNCNLPSIFYPQGGEHKKYADIYA